MRADGMGPRLQVELFFLVFLVPYETGGKNEKGTD